MTVMQHLNMITSKTIENLRKKNRFSVTAVSKSIKKSRETYYRWLKSLDQQKLAPKKLIQLLNAIDINDEYLSKYKNNINFNLNEPKIEYNAKTYELSHFRVVKDLRGDIYKKENISGYLPVTMDNPGNQQVAFQIPDDSMSVSGENSPPSDGFALIDPNEEIFDGDIVALVTNSGRHFIRRIKTNTDTYTLYADNSKYPEFDIKKSNVSKILSVVAFSGKLIKVK